MFSISLENYELKHKGYCADGWAGLSTLQYNVEDCFSYCANRQDVGYFAFNSKNGGCDCYFTANGCPDDDRNNDYNAYRILRSNCLIILTVSYYPKIFLLHLPTL